jgi:integrase
LIYRFNGNQRQVALGTYPQLSLAEARIKREDLKRLLRDGRDPAAACRKPPPGDTFKEVAEEFLMKCRSEELAPVTISKKEWLLEFAYPELGHRRLCDIQPIEVLGVLQGIERNGRHETTRRLRALMGAVFRYGVAAARAKDDPTVALRGATIAPKVKHRAAVTTPERFGHLLQAIETFDGQPTIRIDLSLLALMFPRPGELRFAEWAEVNFEQAVWTIPAVRTWPT